MAEQDVRGHELIDRWTSAMEAAGRSERTIRETAIVVRRAARDAGREPEQLDEHDVIQVLRRRGISQNSRTTYYVKLDSWFRWLVAFGVRDDNPLDHLDKPRPRRADRVVPTATQVERYLASINRRRTRMMALLAAYAGLRVSEVARVHDRDFDLTGRDLTVLGKGSSRVRLPLHPMIYRLAVERAEAGEHGYWFGQYVPNEGGGSGGPVLGNTVSGTLSRSMRRHGCPGTGHSLRHWHATELLRQGVDLEVIRELMRHSSLATTQLYLHVDPDQRRAGLERLPSFGVAAAA